MSASKKGGRKEVRQEELRRLMKEKQKRSAQEKRVQSPFARYNSLAELSCSLCRVRLRSELLWPAHVLGKQHKEKVAELKGGKEQQQEAPHGLPLKRRAPEEEEEEEGGPNAKQESSHGIPVKRRAPEEEKTHKSIQSAGLSLLAGVYDDDEEEDEEAGGADPPPPPPPPPPAAGLPADFFDSALPSNISHSGSIKKADTPLTTPPPPSLERSSNMAEALPEGFFDDPVRDAKVRNVEAPQEQMEKEWEEFQKEIRQVNTKSEAIVAEEDEEGRLERQIEEINQQIECYRRVEVLRDRREVVKSKPASKQEGEEEEKQEEDEDEEELLGLLSRDWRAKGALS